MYPVCCQNLNLVLTKLRQCFLNRFFLQMEQKKCLQRFTFSLLWSKLIYFNFLTRLVNKQKNSPKYNSCSFMKNHICHTNRVLHVQPQSPAKPLRLTWELSKSLKSTKHFKVSKFASPFPCRLAGAIRVHYILERLHLHSEWNFVLFALVDVCCKSRCRQFAKCFYFTPSPRNSRELLKFFF